MAFVLSFLRPKFTNLRPLTSSAALQKIESVTFYFFKNFLTTARTDCRPSFFNNFFIFKRYCCCLNSFGGHLKSHTNLLLFAGMILKQRNLNFMVARNYITPKNTTLYRLDPSMPKYILFQGSAKKIVFY